MQHNTAVYSDGLVRSDLPWLIQRHLLQITDASPCGSLGLGTTWNIKLEIDLARFFTLLEATELHEACACCWIQIAHIARKILVTRSNALEFELLRLVGDIFEISKP